jgi:hypothetical protein
MHAKYNWNRINCDKIGIATSLPVTSVMLHPKKIQINRLNIIQ